MAEKVTECQGDIAYVCDDIESWDCYNNTFRQDCCQTCEDNVIDPVVIGCEFGDRLDQCDVQSGRHCYNKTVQRDCCNTCQIYETQDPGCRYGDKINNCKLDECRDYSPQRRFDCCMTCTFDGTTGADFTTGTFTSGYIGNSTTDLPVTTASSQGSEVPGWVIPVAASVGGILVLCIVIVVVVLCRRNKKSDHLSPITDQMYNDYKLSKRAPIAPPRHPSTEKGWVKEMEEGYEYAYINPDDVDGPQSTDRRSGNDPLPPTPAEYLDLSGAETVSYGYSPSENLARGDLNNKRVPSNKYEQFPTSKTYIKQHEHGEVSNKL